MPATRMVAGNSSSHVQGGEGRERVLPPLARGLYLLPPILCGTFPYPYAAQQILRVMTSRGKTAARERTICLPASKENERRCGRQRLVICGPCSFPGRGARLEGQSNPPDNWAEVCGPDGLTLMGAEGAGGGNASCDCNTLSSWKERGDVAQAGTTQYVGVWLGRHIC